MNKYIHTIGGKPAYFKKQLWYAQNGVNLSKLLVKDLRTIRKQQLMSDEWRTAQGMQATGYGADIGYLRVKV